MVLLVRLKLLIPLLLTVHGAAHGVCVPASCGDAAVLILLVGRLFLCICRRAVIRLLFVFRCIVRISRSWISSSWIFLRGGILLRIGFLCAADRLLRIALILLLLCIGIVGLLRCLRGVHRLLCRFLPCNGRLFIGCLLRRLVGKEVCLLRSFLRRNLRGMDAADAVAFLALLRTAVAGGAPPCDAVLKACPGIPVALLHIFLDVLEEAVAGCLLKLVKELSGVLPDLLRDLLLAGVLHALADLLPLRHHLTDGHRGGRGGCIRLFVLLCFALLLLFRLLRRDSVFLLGRESFVLSICLRLPALVKLGKSLCHGPLEGGIRVLLLAVLHGGNVILGLRRCCRIPGRLRLDLLDQLLRPAGKLSADIVLEVSALRDGLLVPARLVVEEGELIHPSGLIGLLLQALEHIDLLVEGDRGDLVHLVLQDQPLGTLRLQNVVILHKRQGRRQIALQAVSSVQEQCQLTE